MYSPAFVTLFDTRSIPPSKRFSQHAHEFTMYDYCYDTICDEHSVTFRKALGVWGIYFWDWRICDLLNTPEDFEQDLLTTYFCLQRGYTSTCTAILDVGNLRPKHGREVCLRNYVHVKQCCCIVLAVVSS